MGNYFQKKNDLKDIKKEDDENQDEEDKEEKGLEKSFINIDLINHNDKSKFYLDIIWIDEKVFNSENQMYFEKMKLNYPNIKINLFDNLEEGFNNILSLEFISIFVIISGG